MYTVQHHTSNLAPCLSLMGVRWVVWVSLLDPLTVWVVLRWCMDVCDALCALDGD